MGPAAHSRAGPKSAFTPASPNAETNERAKGWKVGPTTRREQRTSRVTPGSQTTWPKPAAPASPLLGVLQRSPTSKLDGRCLRPALPGRRLLKRIGALKPAERGEGGTA